MEKEIRKIIKLINKSKTDSALLKWFEFFDKYIPQESLLDFYFAGMDRKIKYYPEVAIKSLKHFLKNKTKFDITQQYADGAIQINNALGKDGKIKDEWIHQ